jgi:tetratricopeptide (TPR) repeat protein
VEDRVRALPRPSLPPGPLADLFDELHRLHHQAGWPSLRKMAAEVGCSHTTIATAFSGPRPPRWGLLELIVETLGGDTERFRAGWLAATQADADEVAASPSAVEFAYVAPHDLPAPAVPFIGRTAEFALLDDALRAARAGDASNVVLIAGPAGVGKTTLALAWSHTVADRHQDGQLHLDLRGYDVSRPRTPSAAADAVLRRLGVEASAVPRELSEKSALLRSHVAGRELLMVLDNAHSADQVWPLLPGTPSCFVVITSRDTIPGLVARTGARRVVLDRLDEATAAELLTKLLGEPAHADPAAVRALAARCAHLPLALRVAADVVSQDQHHSLAEQVARFDRRPARLDLLDAGGDERTAVRSVFSWSLRRLSPPARSLFELLGVSPTRHLDDEAAAALLGAGAAVGASAVGELLRAQLVERRADTFGLHDLLRDYVIELAAQRPEPERRQARQRLFDHYVARCRRADAAWLRRHRPSLVAVARSAAHDSPAHCLELAALLHAYLEGSGHYSDAIAVQRAAVDVARRRDDARALAAALCRLADVLRRSGALADSLAAATEALDVGAGDPASTANALQTMAAVHVRQGRNEQGSAELGRAAGIFRELGDRSGEAAAANRRGIALMQLGRLTEALEQHERAYTIYRDLDLRLQLGRAANNMGVLNVRLGRYGAASAVLTEALELARATGNRAGVGVALANLGDVAARQLRWYDAADRFRQAIEACEQVGYLGGLADSRRGLGLALAHLGAHDEALALLRDALHLGQRVGDADIEAATLNDLGQLQRLTGADGSESYRAALATTAVTGDPYQRARALAGLGHCAWAAGDHERARDHWRAALDLFVQLDVPEAAEVRTALA